MPCRCRTLASGRCSGLPLEAATCTPGSGDHHGRERQPDRQVHPAGAEPPGPGSSPDTAADKAIDTNTISINAGVAAMRTGVAHQRSRS